MLLIGWEELPAVWEVASRGGEALLESFLAYSMMFSGTETVCTKHRGRAGRYIAYAGVGNHPSTSRASGG